MASTLRAKRVADRIRAEVSDLLQREISDPRLALVTVTDVSVDRELAYATVFVSSVGDEARQKEILQALDGARGFLRREVASRMHLRSMPQLRFRWDPTPERGEKLARLIDDVISEDRQRKKDDTGDAQ